MGSDFRSANFYAVGGPVQPDRACYVKRDADDLLLRRLIGGDYCHVLSQRHTGKTSLAAHTAWVFVTAMCGWLLSTSLS